MNEDLKVSNDLKVNEDVTENDGVAEETEKKPVPWYRNTRLMLLVVVVGIALYYIGTGLWGLLFG